MKRSLMILRAVVVVVCAVGLVVIFRHAKDAGIVGRKRLGPQFKYDISEFTAIDPALMIYNELSSIPVAMEEPSGVFVGPDGRIYVCGEKLLVLEAGGGQVAEIALEAPAYSVTVDDEGLIYLCVGDHLEIYDAAGTRQALWESPGTGAVLGTALVSGETVYVTDVGGHALLRYDKQGVLQGRDDDYVVFGSRNIGLTIDGNGALWAADPGRRGIRKYGEDMNVVAAWQRVGREIDSFSGCCNPEHIAARKDGAIVTSEKNIVRVKVLSQDGELVGVVAGPTDLKGMGTAPAIAVTPDDRVLILDPAGKSVRVFAIKPGV